MPLANTIFGIFSTIDSADTLRCRVPRHRARAKALAALCTAAWCAGPLQAQVQAKTPPPGPARSADSTTSPARAPASGLQLHRPSPDWRDQVLYFVVTDRFADGDPRNNDQGAGEYQPGNRTRYQGGDLAGLRQRLDYIRGLGATGVWLTPPVANQWLGPGGHYSGYHGYWAEHFKQVDAHLGTLDDYRQLSHDLHQRGMVLVQDIVLNHTGDFFWYDKTRDAARPTQGWQANAGTPPTSKPRQAPFHLNDPRDPAALQAGIYHWTPDISDYSQPDQVLNHQMAGLDDLNTDNAAVRRALRDSYGFWLREVGVDGFRVDTAFYVPPRLFDDFLHSRDPAAPGVLQVARSTGRTQFHVFGEGFAIDKPFEDKEARRIDTYMRTPQGRPLMSGMLNFPLYGALGNTFARGRPTAELAHRITATQRVHRDPARMVNFIDNHDVDRFLQGGSEAGLRQALLAMFTLPGIPVVYYGTEQGFTEPRASMFAAGWGSGGRDRFDTGTPLYRLIASLAQLRREHRTLSRGQATVLASHQAGPGALVWRMQHQGETLLVALNTAQQPMLVDHLAVLPGNRGAHARLEPLWQLPGQPGQPEAAALTLDARGQTHLQLPPGSGMVWRVAKASVAAAPLRPAAQAPTLDPLPAARVADDFSASGRAAPGQGLRLVLNGDLARATPVTAGANGRWQARVDTGALVDPAATHRLVAFADTDGGPSRASAARSFQVDRQWTLAAEVQDPAGDDQGPSGLLRYPTEPSYDSPRAMDLRAVRAFTSGGALRVEVQTAGISTRWNPQNGFDHVVFTLFVQLPGRSDGTAVMPLQQGELPGGERWQVRLRAHGWSNALFSAEGASATHEGRPLTPAAQVQVDATRQTVRFTLPASSFAGPDGVAPRSLSGARVWVNTWDYDGGYRQPGPHPQRNTMGLLQADGQPADAASAAQFLRVMDDTPPLLLP